MRAAGGVGAHEHPGPVRRRGVGSTPPAARRCCRRRCWRWPGPAAASPPAVRRYRPRRGRDRPATARAQMSVCRSGSRLPCPNARSGSSRRCRPAHATSAGSGAHFSRSARACARAARIAATAVSTSAASASTRRETVGSLATVPNSRGWPRSTAMSAGQSPPTASVTAKSRMTFPVSWMAPNGVHADSCFDNARSRRSTPAVVVSRLAPANDATPSSPTSTWVRDLRLRFTLRVPGGALRRLPRGYLGSTTHILQVGVSATSSCAGGARDAPGRLAAGPSLSATGDI